MSTRDEWYPYWRLAQQRKAYEQMPYTPQEIPGISKREQEEHYKLYTGYVHNLNKIRQELPRAGRKDLNPTYNPYRALKLGETYAVNGAKLHELYFSLLIPGGKPPSGPILRLIERDFGSFENWKEDLKAAARVARGWAVLAYDLYDRRLHNYVSDAHDTGVVWNAFVLLPLDVYEHAYWMDYATDRGAYIETVLANVNWDRINELVLQYGIADTNGSG